MVTSEPYQRPAMAASAVKLAPTPRPGTQPVRAYPTILCLLECVVIYAGRVRERDYNMPRMKNAPLRYVLAIMRFPTNHNIEKFIPLFQEKVWNDYPQLSSETLQGIQLSVGNKSTDSIQITNKIWQFASEDRNFALILSPDFLVLHAGQGYIGHEDFINRFKSAVEAFVSVNAIAKNMMALGYRYVDLIVPKAGETLSSYLNKWVMPSDDFESFDGISFINSASFMAFSTPQGMLRFQAMRCPPATLSLDLITPFVKKNGWLDNRPEGDFALLDLDHGATLPDSPSITPQGVADRLLEMRTPIVNLFDKAITNYARNDWS